MMNPDPHWRRHPGFNPPWHNKRRFLFRRFVGFLGFVFLFFAGVIAALAYLFTRLFDGDPQTAVLVWLGGCGLAVALPILAGSIAMRSFRAIADPLARVMAAADAVAEGDLSVRVPEGGPGEISRLGRSFNRMATELQRTDQQRRNLTADVAHELRTPVHIIQGNLEGILDGVYSPTPDHIHLLLDETRQLARLVEDLRTLSLAEAGQLALQRELLDVAGLLADSATSFSAQAEEARVSIHVEVGAHDGPLQVHADAGRLDQVLGNLLVNALRHTPPGGQITLSAAPIPSGVRLQVSDNGAGIPPEDLPFIFDRFWQGDDERQRLAGAGSGLGLAIARQLVQAHGGKISVESPPGQGTTFTLEL